jgi:hypothetical protein
MADQEVMVAVVIRKDGTVPFDDDCHPQVRLHILDHLAEHGHCLEPVVGTRHYKIKDFEGHPRPKAGSQRGQRSRRAP